MSPTITGELLSRVEGVSEIIITDNKIRKFGITGSDCLKYYEGSVSSCHTEREISMKAHVLAFGPSHRISAEVLFNNLRSVSSPYTVKPLSYGRGIKKYMGYSFLAVSPAKSTLLDYAIRFKDKAFMMKRFSEQHIKIIGDVVRGILTLHSLGFHCPHLMGNHIFVYDQDNNVSAKIWCFRNSVKDTQKTAEWVNLGRILEAVAKLHDSFTVEIKDLCMRLKNKTLAGLQALKHCALLTVREKFENVIVLNLFVLVHIENHIPYNDPDKAETFNELVNFCSTDLEWTEEEMPLTVWLKGRRQMPSAATGLTFIDTLRDIFEHESEYIPPKIQQSMIDIRKHGRDPDLECQLRIAWREHLLKMHNFVLALDLQY